LGLYNRPEVAAVPGDVSPTPTQKKTAKKLVSLIFVDLEKTLSGFDQHLPSKCSVFPLLFGAGHYQSLETALTNVG
jgi:hypothetical protein